MKYRQNFQISMFILSSTLSFNHLEEHENQKNAQQIHNEFQQTLSSETLLQTPLIHMQQSVLSKAFQSVDQLQETIISQLAQEYQQRIFGDLHQITQKKDKIIDIQKKNKHQQVARVNNDIQETMIMLKQAKLNLTLLLELYLKDKSHNTAINQIQGDIRKFTKFSMIVFVLVKQPQPRDNPSLHQQFVHEYIQKFSSLKQFSLAISQNPRQAFTLNHFTLIQIEKPLRQILHQFIHYINCLKRLIQEKKRNKYLIFGLNRLRVVNAKLCTVSQVLPYCCLVQRHDLFSLPIEHSRWARLRSESITHRVYADRTTLRNSFQSLMKTLNLVNVSMGILDKTRKLPLINISSWLQILRSSKHLVKCILFSQLAHSQAQYMLSSANTALMKQVWNLPQHKIFRDFAQFIFPSIIHSQRLYIPRILQSYFNSNGNIPLPQTKIPFLNQYGNELFRKKSYSQGLRIRINASQVLQPRFQIIDQVRKKEHQGNGILMNRIERGYHWIKDQWRGKTNYQPEKLVFHIHGGGFISMSSFIHQIYTRAWANQLGVPFISVDYGKAPEYPYPMGLYDCFQAYIWTLFYFQQLYEVKPKKIIFLGDSAGGNLAAALINLLIAWKIRLPDGLIMCYPVLSVSSKKYTRSLLGTLQDMILPHTLLKLCESSYTPNLSCQLDPLISPLYSPIEYLSKFPSTQIFVGSKDPFHDDCCRFTQKMNIAKEGNCKITVLQEFPHGFLQFDLKTHPHQYTRRANKQVCQAIRKMFQDLDKQQQKLAKQQKRQHKIVQQKEQTNKYQQQHGHIKSQQ